MVDPPRIVYVAAQRTAVIRLTILREQIQQLRGPDFGELMTTNFRERSVVGPESGRASAAWRTQLVRPLTG
ncbi:MAG TPA: hypothetical protein PLI70_03835 [Gemmatimonadales bacterium]|nr:hypothetical protein [Gemmatimonadales bacterium]HRZ08942.1 hypothetical protein [Gemmatimonadales bacterium]